MEWRFVYSRPEIWTIRDSCVSSHTPIILTNTFQDFLNHYHGLCEKAKESPETFQIPPSWIQSARNRGNKKHNSRRNFHQSPASTNVTPDASSPSDAWRTVSSENTNFRVQTSPEVVNPDFQKFLNTQWQPKVLTPFESRLRNLRTIINKWTCMNHSECKVEFEKWWREAFELGIWRCYFVIQEWFLKVNNERKPNNQWNLDFFQLLVQTVEWPRGRESNVHGKMEEDISCLENSPWGKKYLLTVWKENVLKKDEKGWYSQDYWKYWFTRALESLLYDWFTDSDGKAPMDIWCSLISIFWWNQMLPAHFLPWSFLNPTRNVSELEAWTWRTTLWEHYQSNENEYALRCRSWQKWKELFFEMILDIVEFHPEKWPLRLKFQWMDWNPQWKERMQIVDQTVQPVRSPKKESLETNPVIPTVIPDSVEEFWTQPIPNETEVMENIRCLLSEWKEMGKQGWMDSYLPEWWMENREEKYSALWFSVLLYEALQTLDEQTFKEVIHWAMNQTNKQWYPYWKHEWNQSPPEWVIDFPCIHQHLHEFDKLNALS